MLKRIREIIGQYITLRSLRARIFFIILLAGIIPACMIRQGIMNSYEQRAIEQRAQILQTQLRIVADHLINENYMDNKNSAGINAELTMLSNIYDGRIQIIGEMQRHRLRKLRLLRRTILQLTVMRQDAMS